MSGEQTGKGMGRDYWLRLGLPLETHKLPDFQIGAKRPQDCDGPDWAQCGVCGRWWDDSLVTSLTPAPSARCPFEYEHNNEKYCHMCKNPDHDQCLLIPGCPCCENTIRAGGQN